MIQSLKMPVFIPLFEAPARELFQGLGLVDGVDIGVGYGLRVDSCEEGNVLHRVAESAVKGEIAWLNTTKYDEAISLVDAWFEGNSGRTKCQAFDERVGCAVDCWTYVGLSG